MDSADAGATGWVWTQSVIRAVSAGVISPSHCTNLHTALPTRVGILSVSLPVATTSHSCMVAVDSSAAASPLAMII